MRHMHPSSIPAQLPASSEKHDLFLDGFFRGRLPFRMSFHPSLGKPDSEFYRDPLGRVKASMAAAKKEANIPAVTP